jgi:hypothetical protein
MFGCGLLSKAEALMLTKSRGMLRFSRLHWRSANVKLMIPLVAPIRNGSALPVMFGCGLLSEAEALVLIGSEFKDDMSELHLVQQINQIKYAMANGSKVSQISVS